ncbi:MAG: hypothetical protein A3J37_05075 [Alphaproteobacteria bacterium RIFCSPHIGHO2_12_FULL_45_9]|nr:MAG: hypothetical protein A3B66_04340 [Alphaproteobacteria bacterium RIFCSPHIGHO2_02_FULL_46_13]OFW99387.1 MAG: hypothetical protein A3J37_05075 [Alphaproteobacteria bacterium RIFCSPHIGHO2_12_FULL_45_9]
MSFNDREKAFENKFSLDQQSSFKIEARASKLIGLWAAEKFGLSGADAETYAKEVIAANLDEPGYDDVKRKLKADFQSRNIPFDSAEIDAVTEKYVSEATKQVESEKS